jgi:hypothetical protein
MRGRIRIGRWVAFHAREVLNPHVGFVWAARAAGIITGSDRFLDDRGELDWRLAGLFRVAHEDGPDVSRSAAERAAAEAVWVPTALLPRFGVEWSASDNDNISARFRIAGYKVQAHYSLTATGLVRAVRFDRWGKPDPAGPYGLHAFGGDLTSHTTFDGLTIPGAGSLGWHYGTNEWRGGEFFRYRIADLGILTPARDSMARGWKIRRGTRR